jgi:DeoR family transcriptional regulator, glycerol-3-phosphate regulon repressor
VPGLEKQTLHTRRFSQGRLRVKLNVGTCCIYGQYVYICWFKALLLQEFPHLSMKNLKTLERRAKIVAALRQHGSLSVAELSALAGVSEETVRRDAKMLEEDGSVLKLHGSLALPHNMGETNYERRMRESAPAKLAIARAAAQMVRDGDSLIIDTGTTTTFFARELRQRRNLTIITNSTEIARTLADVAGNKILLAGGKLHGDSGGTYGPTAVDFIARFRVKHTFLSITALDLEAGPMDSSMEEAAFAEMAVTCATHRVIMADSSKFGVTSFARACRWSDVEVIVTEKSPAPEFFTALRDTGTRLVIATP